MSATPIDDRPVLPQVKPGRYALATRVDGRDWQVVVADHIDLRYARSFATGLVEGFLGNRLRWPVEVLILDDLGRVVEEFEYRPRRPTRRPD